MKHEKIKIICNGVNCDPRSLTDVLCFAAERAEWTARSILENIPTDEPERSSMVLEANRNFCLLDVVYSDRVCAALLPCEFRKAVGDALGELRDGFNEYIKRYHSDAAARLLSSGASPTLRGYLATALKVFDEQH